ncbi:Ig-like domain repeat protein, partial [Rhodococcus maanshanensis]
MRRTRARRAAMIGTAALLLVAPCVTLAQAEPTGPAPALPADMVAAIQRDLGLSPAQYLDQADTGQDLAAFADTLRGKFPTAYAGAWLDAAGTPLVGLADGPDKAAARTAVEAAGFKVKDQARSEQVLSGLLGQLNAWVQQLPAPLAGLVNGTAIDPAANDIALNVTDTAAGQGLQLPGFLGFVRVAQGPAASSELPGFGSLGSSDPTTPTKPTEPTTDPTTDPAATTVTLNPIAGATVGKATTLTATVNPAGAGGEIDFADGEDLLGTAQVGANGQATHQWTPTTAGQRTITANFTGRDGVAGETTTTQQVTVAPAGTNTATSTITLAPIKGATAGGKAITLKAKVTPAAAGGTVVFEDDKNTYHEEAQVGADGTATQEWYPSIAGKVSIKATFSGRDGVTGSTTTQQVTVAGPPKPPTTKPTTTKPKPPAANAILGGQAYSIGPGGCSFGFNATDGDGHAVNITAGHCDPHPENAGESGASRASIGDNGGHYSIGTFDKTVIDGGDYALIMIDDETANRFENNFVDTYGGDPLPITGTADPVVGAPVCKSGRMTGFTCGKITAVNQHIAPQSGGTVIANVYDAFAVRVCGIHGDSGGAMVTGTKALGTISAGTRGECNNSSQVWGQPINSTLTGNPGLKVRT